MKRVNKSVARKLYAEKKPFWIVPCNMQPECGILIGSLSFENMAGIPFDTMVDHYEYYNCNSECGRYAAYYIDNE